MASQTGIPTDEIDLLQQLVTWLVAVGWTQDASAAEGGGWRGHLHKSGVYVNLRALRGEYGATIWPSALTGGISTGLGLSLGTGYNGSNAWFDQAGVPTYLNLGTSYPMGLQGLDTKNPYIASPYSMAPFTRYHFFETNDNIVVVLERSP